MKTSARDRTRLFLSLGMTFTFLAGTAVQAAPKTLKCQWRDREVTIDGVADEWEGARTYLKKEKIDVGVLNDDEFLYLSFVTEDEGGTPADPDAGLQGVGQPRGRTELRRAVPHRPAQFRPDA